MLFLSEIMLLLVKETNGYYHQYLGMFNKRQAPLPDMTIQEVY
jgi:hypothetical protein